MPAPGEQEEKRVSEAGSAQGWGGNAVLRVVQWGQPKGELQPLLFVTAEVPSIMLTNQLELHAPKSNHSNRHNDQ